MPHAPRLVPLKRLLIAQTLCAALVACSPGESPELPVEGGAQGGAAAQGDAQKPTGERAEDKAGVAPAAALPEGALDVKGALKAEDVASAFGVPNAFEEVALQGIPPSSSYGSARLLPVGAKHYGVALQVWRESDQGAAAARIERFARQQPGARRVTGLGAKAIRAQRRRVLHLSWLTPDRAEVATLTCDERFCTPRALLSLAQRVDVRLDSLPREAPLGAPPQ